MDSKGTALTESLLTAVGLDANHTIDVHAALERMRTAYRAEYTALSDALRAAAAQTLPGLTGATLDLAVTLIVVDSLNNVITEVQGDMDARPGIAAPVVFE